MYLILWVELFDEVAEPPAVDLTEWPHVTDKVERHFLIQTLFSDGAMWVGILGLETKFG